MNITKRLEAIKRAHRARTDIKDIKNYDHCGPGRQSAHSQHVTIGGLKADRLRIKNLRRAENGLPPKASYAEI